MSTNQVTRDVHVGLPRADFEVELDDSVTIHFHDFANLPAVKGMPVCSPTFSCLGFEWILKVYPGGNATSRHGKIAVMLTNMSPSKIDAKYDVSVKRRGTVDSFKRSGYDIFSEGQGWGWNNFAKRSRVLAFGKSTVTFVVRIRPDRCNYHHTTQLMPLFKLFDDKESSDVSFRIGRRVFHAHMDILNSEARGLARIAQGSTTKCRVPIQGLEADVFAMMLKTLYGQNFTDEELALHAGQILEYSRKFRFRVLVKRVKKWFEKKEKERAAQEASRIALRETQAKARSDKAEREIHVVRVLSNDEVLAERLDMAQRNGEVIEIEDD